MSKRTLQEEYYLQNYNNLTTNISSLKIIAKQIQNHYNFVRLHRNLNFNIRFFPTMEFFHLSNQKQTKVFNHNNNMSYIKELP